MKEMTLAARKDSIPAVTAWVDSELEKLDCPMKAQLQLDIAIDELFGNIALYAYPGGEGSATVQLGFDPASREVSLTFVDSGIPFNPLEHDTPDTTLSAEERAIGGLGIHLVRKTMDSVTYRWENGQNHLRIAKRI